MPLYIPEPSMAPTEPQTWAEQCPGCKQEFVVTNSTRWNQCPRCEGLFCHRCVTTDGHCFACAIEITPNAYPCDNCRAMTHEADLGYVETGIDDEPLTVCPKCYRSLETQRIARHAAEMKARGERAGARELAAIVKAFGASFFREVR